MYFFNNVGTNPIPASAKRKTGQFICPAIRGGFCETRTTAGVMGAFFYKTKPVESFIFA
jgi:hypothetical protein